MLKRIFAVKDHLSLAVKFILVLSIINAIYFQLWHIMSANIFLLVLMFIPQFVKKSSRVNIPKEFEFLLLMFVIVTFFVGKLKWIIAPMLFGVAAGFIGFFILLLLYSNNQIKKNSLLTILFSFNLAVTFGFLIELLKYYLKFILGHDLGAQIYAFSMITMTYVIIGATISSLLGYLYMKEYRIVSPLTKAIRKIKKTNPNLFSQTDDPAEIILLTNKGENERVEFKSTLRTNLHLQKIDRKIEYSVLKTIVAFLNFHGGTLLIGVKDSGKLLGIENDKFENVDRFSLHFTNLIKSKIGKEFLPLINSKSISIEGKTIFKVDCKKSDKQVFLKTPEGEEFYTRAGPSNAQLKGSELVEYILRRFMKFEKHL